MANYVVIGAGASGLYTAFRLLTGGSCARATKFRCMRPGPSRRADPVWYTFPPAISQDGLYAEFGGMRFAVDARFPTQIVEGHVLVQNMLVELDLQNLVVPFLESTPKGSQPKTGRMYYLRENQRVRKRSIEAKTWRNFA